MALKGLELAMETVVKMTGVVFIGLLIGIILVNALGGLKGAASFFCRYLPVFCEEELPVSYKDEVAFNSVRALVCAINSVNSGEEQACLDSFKSGGEQTAGFAAAEKSGMSFSRVSCRKEKGKITGCYIENFFLPEDFGGLEGKAKEFIAGYGNPSYLVYFQNFPPAEDMAWKFKDNWYNKVLNVIWVLPVTNIIRFTGVGAIKLVYRGGKWTAIAGTAGLAKPVIGFFERLVGRVAKSVEKEGLKIEVKAIYLFSRGNFRKLFKWWGNDKVVGYLEKLGIGKTAGSINKIDDLIDINKIQKLNLDRLKVREDVFRLGEGKIKPKDLEYSVVDVLKDSHVKNILELTDDELRVINRFLLRAGEVGIGVTTLTEYLASLEECESQKQTSKPGKVVVQRPLKCRSDMLGLFDVVEDKLEKKEGENDFEVLKPVILEKSSHPIITGNPPVPLYFASPCHADIEISKSTIECPLYEYNKNTGYVHCSNPRIVKSSNLRSCGFEESVYDGVKTSGGLSVRYTKGFSKRAETKFAEYNSRGYSKRSVEANPFVLVDKLIEPFRDDDISYRNIRAASCKDRAAYTADTLCFDFDVYRGESPLSESEIKDITDSLHSNLFVCNPFTSKYPEFFPYKNENQDYENLVICQNALIEERYYVIDKTDGRIVSVVQHFRSGLYKKEEMLIVFLLDEDRNGEWDGIILDTIFSSAGTKTENFVHLGEKTEDGLYNYIMIHGTAGCKVPGTVVRVAKWYDDEHNFCYQTTNKGKRIASFGVVAGSVLLDIYLTKGLATKTLSRAAATGIIVLQTAAAWWSSWTLNEWPG